MKKRIQWLDFGKGFFILWVVVAHALKSIYSRPIYSYQTNMILHFLGDIVFFFIMPAFFALAGFLFRKRTSWNDYFQFVLKKAINLFVPYIVFSIIYVLLQHFSSGVNHHYSFHSLLNIWYQPISYLWFLYVLFFIFVLVGLMSLLNINLEIQFIICLIGFIFVCLFKPKLTIFQTFGDALFFLTGALTNKHLHIIVKHKNTVLIASQLLSIISLITCFMIIGIQSDYNNPTLINIIPKILVSFSSLTFCMNQNEKTAFFRYFDKYGKDSLVIYLVHAPIVSVICILMFKITIPNFLISFLILLMFGWFISIIAVVLKQNNSFLQAIFNPYKILSQFFNLNHRKLL
jgi:fucose 4-O-acetylase-like acetyltransferase